MRLVIPACLGATSGPEANRETVEAAWNVPTGHSTASRLPWAWERLARERAASNHYLPATGGPARCLRFRGMLAAIVERNRHGQPADRPQVGAEVDGVSTWTRRGHVVRFKTGHDGQATPQASRSTDSRSDLASILPLVLGPRAPGAQSQDPPPHTRCIMCQSGLRRHHGADSSHPSTCVRASTWFMPDDRSRSPAWRGQRIARGHRPRSGHSRR